MLSVIVHPHQVQLWKKPSADEFRTSPVIEETFCADEFRTSPVIEETFSADEFRTRVQLLKKLSADTFKTGQVIDEIERRYSIMIMYIQDKKNQDKSCY